MTVIRRDEPGSERPAPDGWVEVLRVTRPTDGTLVGELAVTSPNEVPRRVDRARAVQVGWASLTPRDRARRLRGLLEAVGAREREIQETIVAETGKPRTEALLELVTVTDLLRYYLRTAPSFLKPRNVSTGWLVWKRALILREPFGVVGVISPWNHPFVLSMTPVVTALFGGNAAVLKPSEHAPYTGLLAEDLARDAGLPEDLVQVVVGGGATGEALVRAGVDKVFFTGGADAARSLLRSAAESLTPVVLELGGKDAAIVLEDADLERAARGIVWGAFMNAGQTCIGVERAYVVEEVFDAFVREVLALVRKLKVGSTQGVSMGPMTTPAQLRRVEEHVDDAVSRGAVVVAGGGRTDPASNVLEPTVLTDLDPDSLVLRDETFGPVLPLMPVRDSEEAVQRANGGDFGLSASVWTRDRARGLEIARRLRTGSVCVNDVLVNYSIPGLPFGGVGRSGYGRSKGMEGLAELTRTQGVAVDRLGLKREPWWFPYSRASERMIRGVLLLRWKGAARAIPRLAATFLRRTTGG
jgi:acyl-CoA reductase-like NAD-dependent aldehyde dehydrogenase